MVPKLSWDYFSVILKVRSYSIQMLKFLKVAVHVIIIDQCNQTAR